MRPSSLSTVIPVALVLAVSGLLAVASQGRPAWTLVQAGDANRLAVLLDLLLLFGFVLVVLLLLVYVARRAGVGRNRAGGAAGSGEGGRHRLIPLALAWLTGVSLFMMTIAALGRGRPLPDMGLPQEPGEAEASRGLGYGVANLVLGDEESPRFADGGAGAPGPPASEPYGLIALGLVLAVLAGAAWWWARGRRTTHTADPPELAPRDGEGEKLREAIVFSIDEMLADPDPNTAIRGAYARLLEALEARGRGRKDHEGPMEHLHRVLSTLQARPQPLGQLVHLFELARFSPRRLDDSHRDEALAALRAVAADLKGATGVGARPVARAPGKSTTTPER